MGRTLDVFCEENSLSRLEFFFYTTKGTGKIVYVDEGKTAEQNGFTSGKKIFYEKVGDNKLWRKKDQDEIIV